MLRIKECKPLLNHVILTANRYEEGDYAGGIIDDDHKLAGNIKEYQKVIAVGPNVKDVKPGDFVVISPKSYCKPVHKQTDTSVRGLINGNDEVEMRVEFPVINVNGNDLLFLYDRDIELIVTEYEFVNDTVTGDDDKRILS